MKDMRWTRVESFSKDSSIGVPQKTLWSLILQKDIFFFKQETLHFLSNEVLLLSSAVGAVAIQDSFLYVCGGFDGISSLDTVERYDPDLDSWKNIARMNKNRSAAGVVHLDGKIYSLGGHNGLSIFESVEFYDTRRGNLQ